MRVRFGEYELDTEKRTLQRAARRIPTQSKAFDLLSYLIERRERVVSSDELLDALWPGLHVTPAALSTAVQKARQAVGDDGGHQAVIHTEHGKGFRFVAEVIDLSESEVAVPRLREAGRRRPRLVWVAAAGATALLLAAIAAWLLDRPAIAPESMRSVAVLPFENLSQDPATEAFTSGIHDDVLTQISKISELKVIANTSVQRLDPDLGVQEIGSRLGVAALLEGGVQRAGDRIRINVQLVDCETRTHLWAETYDRELTAANIFDIQNEIATAVARKLRGTLSPKEQDRLASTPTENLDAYQAYLLGKQRFRTRRSSAAAEAAEYFQQAIELDPSFALAYVGLADAYTWQIPVSGISGEELRAKARAAIDKALALDDQLGEAYNSLAEINWWDPERAEAAFRRALELNPNYAAAYSGYGELLRQIFGRTEEALALHRKAIELDPLSGKISAEIGRDLSDLGRFDEALAWLKKALEVNPDHYTILIALADHYWYIAGQLDQAVGWYAKAMFIDPGDPSLPAYLGWLFLDLGDPDAAKYWIERSIALGPEGYWPRFSLAMLHLYRDDEAARVYMRKLLTGSKGRVREDSILRRYLLRAGQCSEVRAMAEKRVPALLNEHSPEIDTIEKYSIAIDLALCLSKAGEQERADLLLDRSLQHIQTLPRLGWDGYWIADAQIYALQGKKQEALIALRQAIDEGWRSLWWYFLKSDPSLESLHDEPEYQAMVAEIEADMAAQLAHVREMERKGELEPISEVSATSQ